MAIDISGLNFFMSIFSFLFVFLIFYSILFKTKILGENKFIMAVISFIMSFVFMSFASMELYVRTIIPWLAVLVVVVFLVLVLAGMSTKKLDDIMTSKFAWVFIIILLVIFLIAAIQVFNPIFHPDKIITSGNGGQSIVDQLRDVLSDRVVGGILLVIVAIIVSWIITRGK